MAYTTQSESVEKEVVTVSEPKVVKTTNVVTSDHPVKTLQKKKVIFRFYQVVWYILSFIEVLLGFRMVLKVLGANPSSGFAGLVYGITDPLVFPFSGILPSGVSGGSMFEWATIFAAIVYFFVAWAIVYLLQLIKPVTAEEVEDSVDQV